MEDIDEGLLTALVSDSDGDDSQDWGNTEWAQPPPEPRDSSLAALGDVPKTIDDGSVTSVRNLRVTTQPEGSSGNIVKRMQLNDNKAGMEGLDKERINQIIYQASKDSKFYENERKKDEQMKLRIEEQKRKIGKISDFQLQQGLIEANKLLAELEQSRDLSRTIVHVDMDAFYAAVEMRENPALQDRPMAVGGNSMLSTSNYHARKFGVRAAMPGFIARKLCPELIIVPTSFDKYTAVSKQVRSIMSVYDPGFCPMSLDEAYLDLTPHLAARPCTPPGHRTVICRDKRYTHSRHHCLCDLNEVIKDPYNLNQVISDHMAHSVDVSDDLNKVVKDNMTHSVGFGDDKGMGNCYVKDPVTHTGGVHDNNEEVNDSMTETKYSPTCETGTDECKSENDACKENVVKDDINSKEHKFSVINSATDKTTPSNVCPVCSKEFPPFTSVEFGVSDEEAVRELRTRIEQLTRLTASAGIAPNMMLAKVCSDRNKPDGQYRIPPTRDTVLQFIRDLPTRKISGIGKVSELMLNAVGVYTCTDLWVQRALLYHLYSPISLHYFMRICLGIGATTVERDSDRKSISTERTFQELSRPEDLYAKCAELCDSLAQDLKDEQMMGKTVTLKIKTVKFKVTTRAQSLTAHTADRDTIHRAATELLKTEILACAPHPLRLRLMGVRMSSLVQENQVDGKPSRQNTITGAFQKILKSQTPGQGYMPTASSTSLNSNSPTQDSSSEVNTPIQKLPNQSSDEVKGDSIQIVRLYEKSSAEEVVKCTDDDNEDGIPVSGIPTKPQEAELSRREIDDNICESPSETDEVDKDYVANFEACDVSSFDNSVSVDGESTGMTLGSVTQHIVNNESSLEAANKLSAVSGVGTSLGKHAVADQTDGHVEAMAGDLAMSVNSGEIEHNKSQVTLEHEDKRMTNIEPGDNSQTYSRMRSGRVRTPDVSRTKRRGNSSARKNSKLETFVCPVCCQPLACPGLDDFNEHIDRCLTGKTHVSDNIETCSKLITSSENITGASDTAESYNDNCFDISTNDMPVNLDKRQHNIGGTDLIVDSMFKPDESGILAECEQECSSFAEFPSKSSLKCDHKSCDTATSLEETSATREINNNNSDQMKYENVLHVETSSDFVTDNDCGTDTRKVSLDKTINKVDRLETENQALNAALIDDACDYYPVTDNVTDKPATTEYDGCSELSADTGHNECDTNPPPLPRLPDKWCSVQKEQPAVMETISVEDVTEDPSCDNVGNDASDQTAVTSQESDINSDEDSSNKTVTVIDSSMMKRHSHRGYNQQCDIPSTSKQAENTVDMNDSNEDNHIDTSPVMTDDQTMTSDTGISEPGLTNDKTNPSNTCSNEPDLLVCPICNVEQRVVSLAAFNDHVDSCLSRGAITEILREQRRNDKGNVKRSLSTGKSASQPPTKRKKTAMPPIKLSSCRSIASFFKDK